MHARVNIAVELTRATARGRERYGGRSARRIVSVGPSRHTDMHASMQYRSSRLAPPLPPCTHHAPTMQAGESQQPPHGHGRGGFKGGSKAAQRTNARTVEREVRDGAPFPGLRWFDGSWGFCKLCLYENESRQEDREVCPQPSRVH